MFRRAVILLFGLTALGLCQPQLTTIQDSLYKADGTRFNGSAVITWNTFDAGDTSIIGTQTVTVHIVNGSLFVQLVPNAGITPARPYTVHYSSDGKAQFSETWYVPFSPTPLRVREVRAGATSSSVTPPPGQTPVLESDVIGLISDLGLRPVQGPGFGVGRTAVINSVGAIETVIGNLGDCVHVDGTSGPCSDPTQIPTFIDSESPGGIVDGTNMSFSLASTPIPASGLSLYRNGLFQKTGFDYTLTGSNVQFMAGATPQPGDTIVASYRVDGTGSLSLGGLTTSPPAIATVGFAQVICSSTGTSTSSVTQVSLGSCTAPANLFKPGDRIEVRFDFAHQGTSSGFDFRVRWGGTMMVQRTAQPGDAVTAGRGEAAIGTNRSQLSIQSWGTLLGLLSGLVNATDSLTAPLKIDFLANLTLTGGDSVTLLNYTVLRYPAISHP